MHILVYKFKKKFTLAKIAEFTVKALFVLLVFGFLSMIGTLIFEVIITGGILIIQLFGIPLNPSDHAIDISSALLSMITVGALLVHIDRQEKRDNAIRAEKEAEIAKDKPVIESRVNKTVQMEVVSKKEVITQQGIITRELMFRDSTGRVIDYEKSYNHPNINTVFFAVEEGKSYNIEWHFYDYDPTGKSNRYDKILKINGTDVDLNQ
jgi:hypothetical protein